MVVPENQVMAFSPSRRLPLADRTAGFEMNSDGSWSNAETTCPPSDELCAETGSLRNWNELSRLCACILFAPNRNVKAIVRRFLFIGNKCTKNECNMSLFINVFKRQTDT